MTRKLNRVPTNSPFIESGGEVTIDETNLGYDPTQVWIHHKIQFTTLAGGTARVQHKGPAGTFVDLSATEFTEDGVAIINNVPLTAIKIVFTGTGGVGEAHVESRHVDAVRRVRG